MIYLRNFRLLNEDEEWDLLVNGEKKNIYNNIYPFKLFPSKELTNKSHSSSSFNSLKFLKYIISSPPLLVTYFNSC